jgi:hypothetical protein
MSDISKDWSASKNNVFYEKFMEIIQTNELDILSDDDVNIVHVRDRLTEYLKRAKILLVIAGGYDLQVVENVEYLEVCENQLICPYHLSFR